MIAVVTKKTNTDRENSRDKGQDRDNLLDITYEIKNYLLYGDQVRACGCPSFRPSLYICSSISDLILCRILMRFDTGVLYQSCWSSLNLLKIGPMIIIL
jgi:hypothetical protein